MDNHLMTILLYPLTRETTFPEPGVIKSHFIFAGMVTEYSFELLFSLNSAMMLPRIVGTVILLYIKDPNCGLITAFANPGSAGAMPHNNPGIIFAGVAPHA